LCLNRQAAEEPAENSAGYGEGQGCKAKEGEIEPLRWFLCPFFELLPGRVCGGGNTNTNALCIWRKRDDKHLDSTANSWRLALMVQSAS
jgi:hypothetical protein